MRRLLAPLCALAVLVPLQGIGSATPPSGSPQSISNGTGPLDNEADLAAALHYEELVREHDGGGYVVPLEFDSWPELNPDARPTRMHGEGDSGNYTGEYLAAESFRYALAKKELAKHGRPAVREFWQGQLDDAKAKVRETVDYYHLISTISKNWNPALDPKVNPDGSPADPDGWLDLGASGVPGEPGLLMRICTPEQVDPEKPWFDVRRNYAPDNPSLFGPLLWDDGKKYWCLAANSRDSYAGTWFGLATALDLVGDDAHVKQTVAGDLLAMADYATKYLWAQPRPHGRVSNPVTGNDLRGPVSPMWAQVPLHQLGMLQVARHAAALTGDTVRSLKYEAMYAAESAASIASGALVHEVMVDVTQPHNAYYKYQLNWAHFFNLIRLEDDPVRREAYELALSAQNATTDRHDNAFFEAMTYALDGDDERLGAAVRDHHLWLDYIAFHEAAAARGQTPFLHTPRCSITTDPGPDAPLDERPLACVPKDENDIIITKPDGTQTRTVFTPGTVADLRALDPLPVGVRRLADFLWQKDPTIVGGDHDVPWRGPSIDFLVTYWMTRYYSEAAVPAVQPLPAWLGPAFS